jgi:Domain of unknown function (DUF6456)
MSLDPALRRFVRGLLGGGIATRTAEFYTLANGSSATAEVVLDLIGSGALAGTSAECRANTATRGWLKRAYLDADAFAAQHRVTASSIEGATINLAESPLSRLASGDTAFLGRHHVEAGERVRRLVERAQLQPRLTMTYSASRTAGAQHHKNDISDMAVDARRAIDEIHHVLPRDCASVVLDVCGFLKGLQEVERDHGWPRRSAKLVLRIGLEQLAQHYGIGVVAVGREQGRARGWMAQDARPTQLD